MVKIFTAIIIIFAHSSWGQKAEDAPAFLAALDASSLESMYSINVERPGANAMNAVPEGAESPVQFALTGINPDGTTVAEKILTFTTERSSHMRREAKVLSREIVPDLNREALSVEVWRSLFWQQGHPAEGFEFNSVPFCDSCIISQWSNDPKYINKSYYLFHENQEYRDASDQYDFTLYVEISTRRLPAFVEKDEQGNEVFENTATRTSFYDDKGKTLTPPRVETTTMKYTKNKEGQLVKTEIVFPNGHSICVDDLK